MKAVIHDTHTCEVVGSTYVASGALQANLGAVAKHT
jgi:hypothetical protein